MRNFYYLIGLSIMITSYSCNEKTLDCSELKFDGKITTLNGENYTGGCFSYFDNRKIESERHYLEGLDHGKWRFFFENGKTRMSGTFTNGKRIGMWKYYFESGKIWKEQFYRKPDKRGGVWRTYNEDSIVLRETWYSITPQTSK